MTKPEIKDKELAADVAKLAKLTGEYAEAVSFLLSQQFAKSIVLERMAIQNRKAIKYLTVAVSALFVACSALLYGLMKVAG